jgi:hypothetical protein
VKGYITEMAVKTRKPIEPPPAIEASGYARIETALARVYGAEDVQKSTFSGRLKHFRKLGVPARKPGKGTRIEYEDADLWQLMICLELSEFGIDPTLIVKIVRRHWEVSGYLPQAIQLARQFPGNDRFVAIPVNFMSHAWAGGWKETKTETSISISQTTSDPVGGVEYFLASDYKKFLEVTSEPGERALVFNLSARVRAVEKALREC